MRYLYVILAFGLGQNIHAQNLFFLKEFNRCPDVSDTLVIYGDTSYVWYYTNDPGTILSTSDTLIIHSFEDPLITVASPNDTLSFSHWTDAAFCYCQVYIPNIFTPDGDAFNDKFFPVINCGATQGIRLTVCNRMGKVVFDETSLNWPEWDGTNPHTGEAVSQGLYGWQVSFIQESGETQRHQGHVFLSR